MATTCRKCGKQFSRCLPCKGTGKWSDLLGSGVCSKCKGTG